MSATQAEKFERFKALHRRSQIFLMPNPWDAGTARLLTTLGFEALASTSSGFAFTLGRLDGEATLEHYARVIDGAREAWGIGAYKFHNYQSAADHVRLFREIRRALPDVTLINDPVCSYSLREAIEVSNRTLEVRRSLREVLADHVRRGERPVLHRLEHSCEVQPAVRVARHIPGGLEASASVT